MIRVQRKSTRLKNYLCGGTEEQLAINYWATKTVNKVPEDGFVARFNAALGSQQEDRVGTSDYDQTFLLDVDKLGNIRVWANLWKYPITAGSWGTPQYRKQFIHKIGADLSTSMAFWFAARHD